MTTTVTLTFKNLDAFEDQIVMQVDKASVEHICRWYDAFYSGDRYKAYLNGNQLRFHQDGEPIS